MLLLFQGHFWFRCGGLPASRHLCAFLRLFSAYIAHPMRMRSSVLSLVLLLLLFLVFLIRRWNEPKRKEAFDRGPLQLVYTAHARCQMECRRIKSEDVIEIMTKGVIIFNRSNRRANPCPIFTLQGRTSANRSMLVIFEQCPKETKVLTAAYLKENSDCNCPGSKQNGGR